MSSNLHDLPTEEVRTELALRSTTPWQKVLLCDVLLSRQEEIRELTYSFDDLVGLLRREQLNRILYTANEFTVTTILRVLTESKRRKMPQIEWFASDRSSQVGPMMLDQLVQWINDASDKEIFFWREEWEQWKPISDAPFWSEQPFFRQTFPSKEKNNSKTDSSYSKALNQNSSAMPVLMGIFQAVSFPFWLVMIFVAIFTGFNTFLGPLLPTVFATFMVFICIPLSIGLFLKKRWAWGMLLFTTIFGMVWFGGHVIFDGASKLWLLLAVFEGIILTLALTAKDAFS